MIQGQKIIVEGCDNCGKTHYIQEFVKEHPEYEVIHCSRLTPNNVEYFKELLTDTSRNIIFDRCFHGQFIYQTKKERDERNWLSLNDLCFLESLVNMYKIPVIYVKAKPEVVAYLCSLDKNDQYYNEDYIKDIMNRYEYFFKHISTIETLQEYFNDYTPEEYEGTVEVDYRGFDYESLPKVVAVDFDGTLVYGKKFPEIGILNENLVKELYEGKYKDYKKILFTHRSGDNLLDACNFLADHDIHFDAINDDIPEIKKILNRNPIDNRKIWFDIIIDDKADISNIIYD